MKTSEIIRKFNIPRHKIYYLEQKGYINPRKIPAGEMESREYSEEDIRLIEIIWKYLKEGFKHRVAYEKAIDELNGKKGI